MWDYRGERWWPLLTSILEVSLKCAYLTAKVNEYVSNCIELIGYCILLKMFVTMDETSVHHFAPDAQQQS